MHVSSILCCLPGLLAANHSCNSLTFSDSCADPSLVKEAADKSMNVLMWAADPQSQLTPLDKEGRSDARAAWSNRFPHARACLQAEVAAAGRHMADLELCPGSCGGDSEASTAAVGCALFFEVLGSICGLLPPPGWLRARQLFLNHMVRTTDRQCCFSLHHYQNCSL